MMPEPEKKSSVHWYRMLLLFLIFHVSCVSSFAELPSNQSEIQEYLNDQSQVLHSLLNESYYDKRFIPAIPGKPLKVQLEVVVYDVVNLDDRSTDAEMILYVRQQWYDYRLSWNSSKRVKVREHFLDKIWIPDLRIINLKEMKRFDISGGVNMNLHPNGRVYFSQVMFAKISCPMDLHKFPMDRQSCLLKFSSFAYGRSLMVIRLAKKKIDVRPIHLAQFDFVEAKEISDHDKRGRHLPRATITLTFKRRSGYYIIQIYIPTVFLVVLSWLTFFMNTSDISDRLALEITMILSIVFLHGGTNTSLPPVSYAKASDWYFIVSFAFIFIALLETIVVYRISLFDERKQAKRSKSTFLKRYASQLSCKSNTAELVDISAEQNMEPGENSSMVVPENHNLALSNAPNITKPWCLTSLIDKVSIVVFPAFYIGFNIFYWFYYMHIQ